MRLGSFCNRSRFIEVGWILVLSCVGISSAIVASPDNPAAVVGSKHDLSVRGTGSVVSSQNDPCVFCHASHLPGDNTTTSDFLWNRDLPSVAYRFSDRSTGTAGSPTGSPNRSKLCLSCHDGTTAPGQTISKGTIRTSGGLGKAKVLGTDLSVDHPVAIMPVDNGGLVPSLFGSTPRSSDSEVVLFDGRVECTSCHTPHQPDIDPIAGNFLVRPNTRGALCLACHDSNRPGINPLSGWTLSAHATASVAIPSGGPRLGPYGTVEENACLNCHRPHRGESSGVAYLLTGKEEAACDACHKGANEFSAASNVVKDFGKTYVHPTVVMDGLHNPAESTFPLNENRHAECVDCHQPHSSQTSAVAATPPAVQPALVGTSGFDGSGPVIPAASEYEVCFKCHADSQGKPQQTIGYSAYGYSPLRQTERSLIDPKNLRKKFASAVSRHNVTQPRRLSVADVPSLRPFILTLDGSQGRALGMGGYLYCTDCHASEDARRLGGNGANGPHGSIYSHILTARYEVGRPMSGAVIGGTPAIAYTPGPGGTAALCNMCHEVDESILQDRSFKKHRKHVLEAGIACATCHDPHGIQDAGGNLTNNRALISFDLNIVGPDKNDRLYFDSVSRECYLTCHGVEHGPKTY